MQSERCLLESAEELAAIDAVIADTVAGLGRFGVVEGRDDRQPFGRVEPRILDDELPHASQQAEVFEPTRVGCVASRQGPRGPARRGQDQPMSPAAGTKTGDPDAAKPGVRTPVTWGLVFGAIQAASPLAFWWLDAATVYALGLVLIASVYIGFAVADGRPTVIAIETTVAAIFVIVAAAAVTASPWLLVLGLAGHGLKDLWQHRRKFVANTRWWPPFCLVVDWIAAAIIAIEILAGVHFH